MTESGSKSTASASATQSISTLRRKRGSIIGQITAFIKFLDTYEQTGQPNIPLLKAHLNGLNETWKRFDDIQFLIEELDESEETRRYEINSDYYAVIARASVIIEDTHSPLNTRRPTTESVVATITAPMSIKLPEMRLPTFDGTIEKWTSFYDIFSSMIDRNEDLSPVQKLQYLQSTLTGKAAACIQSLSTTEANYTGAIELLKKKFDCTRRILLRHCDAIRELPKLAKDTSEDLGELVDVINQHLRALKNLGEDISSWNTLLISIILSKIGSETAWQWELTLKDKKMPSYTHLLEFLEKRANCAPASIQKSVPSALRHTEVHTENRRVLRPRPARNYAFLAAKNQSSEDSITAKPFRVEELYVPVKNIQCPVCKGEHNIWHCEVFHGKGIQDRINSVERASLCFNCLKRGHSYNACFSSSCRICNKRHHTFLHQAENVKNFSSDKPSSSNITEKADSERDIQPTATNELLVTAQVSILNGESQPIQCRALIDTGATANFITDELAKQLKIKRDKCSVPIGTLNALCTVSKSAVSATIVSRTNEYQRTLTFLTVPNIASLIPDQPINRAAINIPKNLKLADPTFYEPAPIDLLLGAGVALSILCVGQINLSPFDGSDLYLQKTRLGWIIGGSAPVSTLSRSISCHATTTLENDLARFWEIEEGPQIPYLSESERICEAHFSANVQRNTEGRYVVALPFNDKLSKLGESKTQALKRLLSLERKLQRDAALYKSYSTVIQEYIDLGHMSEVPSDSNQGHYLPHHGVTKVSSQTTKLRVVFDGSAVTNTGISLNDTLHVGPKIQHDLLYILLRFRIHKYVLTADIEKMYRQFLVRAEDRKYQQILWRDPTNQVKTYQLNTVTFGLSAAAYLAIRCLKQLAEDEGHRFSNASLILQRDFYVDDALTGASSIEEAINLRDDLIHLLKLAGLNIRQWASNDKLILDGLAQQNIHQNLHLGESSQLKTLGIVWNSANDSITYVAKVSNSSSKVAKRIISSEIAKIYDPLGLLGPIIVVSKILLQKIWTLKIDWDESLPMHIYTEWKQFYTQLPLLNNVIFQRKTILHPALHIEMHGFCDTSEKAYGSCVYLRSIDIHGQIQTELLFAKSKVTPLKSQTIPRLELCAALLLASLVETAKKALHISVNHTVFWTDSTIVLQWLNTSPHTLKTFVANRTSEIQTRTNIADWRHVPTADNPADLISRGQLPEDFLRPSIWQHGPAWLQQEESAWPKYEIISSEPIPEQKTTICLSTTRLDASILDKYSSWGKMQRIIAYCLRWRRHNSKKGILTSSEIRYAHDVIIRLIQKLHFPDEIRYLDKGKNDEMKVKSQKLSPFIDQDGILRVGGRLKHSAMPFAQKHPILLPKTRVTSLIIKHEHRAQLHAGVQTTLYAIRRRYWPIDGRSQVWKTVKNCVRCCRAQPPPINYVMGNLPEARVTESRPFTHVGVDYCGPFYIKERRYRNTNKIKVYVAVFICLAVKAVHLELVSDLTSDAFLAALRRFIGRRGFCTNMYSDNGTNFVGANNELRELRELLRSDDHREKVQIYLSEHHIVCSFIPPLAPHFGGLWEAAVKSFKHHLKRVVGNALFTFENLNTLIIEIEAILNSRPLTPISSDPNDLLVLTPSHFLIGDSLTSLRERDFRDVSDNRLSRWQHIQKLKQHFWSRWHREYLNELTNRSKWHSGSHSVKKGTIVLLREDNVPSMQWPLAKVIKVHPGSDGVIRAVTVKTATGTLDRSVKRLVLLPNQTEEDQPTDSAAKEGSHQHPTHIV